MESQLVVIRLVEGDRRYRFSLWRINFRSWSIENQNLDLGEMFRTTAFENHRQEDISPWSRSTILDRAALEDKVLPWNSQIILDGSEFRGGRCCWSEGCANVDCRMSIDQMQIKIRLLCRGRMRAYSLCAYLCVILIADLWLSCRNICSTSRFSVLFV